MEMSRRRPRLLARIERETSELLGDLIRIDTSNPPGNETAVASWLDQYFRRLLWRRDARRAGRAAQLRRHPARHAAGAAPGPDGAWTSSRQRPRGAEPPFTGVARRLPLGPRCHRREEPARRLRVALRRLVEAGRDFAGTVVLVAEADEEDGAVGGARWLVTQRPDLVRCDYLLNEGGGKFIVVPDGERLYELQSARKVPPSSAWSCMARGATPRCRCATAMPCGAADVVRALVDYRPALSLESVPPDSSSARCRCRATCPAARRGRAAVALAELGERDRRAQTSSRLSTALPGLRRRSWPRAARR